MKNTVITIACPSCQSVVSACVKEYITVDWIEEVVSAKEKGYLVEETTDTVIVNECACEKQPFAILRPKTTFLINAIKDLQFAYSKIPPNLDELDNEPSEEWRKNLIQIEDSIETALFKIETYCDSADIETGLFDFD